MIGKPLRNTAQLLALQKCAVGRILKRDTLSVSVRVVV